MPSKRPASGTTTSQHTAKKRAIAKGQSTPKAQASTSNSKEKSRRRPVTAKEEDDELDGESSEDDDGEFPQLYDEEPANEMEMDVDPGNISAKDPNGE